MATAQQFFAAVLNGLGIPETQSNLQALAMVAHLEGQNSRYNPLNSVVPSGNSSSFNSVGVQDYKSFENGVSGTIALLKGGIWNGVVNSLKSGGVNDILGQFASIYNGWDPGTTAGRFMTDPGTANNVLNWNIGPGGGGGVSTGPVSTGPMVNNPATTGSLGDVGTPGYSSALATHKQTPAELKADLITGAGPLAGLLTSIPELQNLLNQAVTQGQTVNEFMNAVNNSQWYRTHSDAVRTAIAQQASDPATYARMLGQEQAKIQKLADQMGVQLTPAQVAKLAGQSYMQGFTPDQLSKQLAGMFNKSGQLGGTAAQVFDELSKSAAAYGQTWNDASLRYRTQQVLANPGMLDTYKELLKTQAKAMYPGLISSIDSGLTVSDIASPYKQTMGSLLEIDPATLALNDRMLKQALQGTGQVGKGQQPSATPLWQFEQQVRADPRWQMTKNAHADTSSLLETLGKDWGFSAA